jgi:hypothetical protein
MKRKDQEEFSSKLVYYGFIGILITLLILVITNR